MSLTDLTNTKWVLNSNPDLSQFLFGESFSINFISDLTNFTSLTLTYDLPRMVDIHYNSQSVYNSQGWTDEIFRSIEITGGTDATNSTLIAWLEANGTLTPPQPPAQTNKIFIGASALSKALLGDTELASVWLGNIKLYEKS